MPFNLGKTLLIANPAAQHGNGAQAAQVARDLLGDFLEEGQLRFVLTNHAGHACELAADLGGSFETVIALGGDGVIHEVVNGLMRIDPAERPCFGVIPVGSGNDYARTLGMSESVSNAVAQLANSRQACADVGCCNGEYFAETLSFGLDAAIALDTVERRKRTGEQGAVLYLKSGLDELLHHLDLYRFSAVLDGQRTIVGAVHMLAVQVGPTYGGGFRICPEARIDDGMLDICYAEGPMSVVEATIKFLSAKGAHHTHFENIHFDRASSIELEFDCRPPCQIDGESHVADNYSILVVPNALHVLKDDTNPRGK